MFNDHHRFEFYRGEERIKTLEVCFQCRQTHWDAWEHLAPQTFYLAMTGFLATVGLEAERDWVSLFKAQP